MARVLPSLLVVALLGATAAAFALTEGLKLQKSPVTRTQVGLKVFSPVCVCPKDHVPIRFFLRKADHVTVTIRKGGKTIDTLVDGRAYPRGWVRVQWNGIQPSGIVVPDGTYLPAVHLTAAHRTIVLPNPIDVDTTPPGLVGAQAAPRVLSPDGDGRGDRMTVRYKTEEKAHGILYVDRRRVVRTKFARTSDKLHFFGKVDGKPLATGAHQLTFAAEDEAGNLSDPIKLGTLTIRYVTLARKLVSVGPGERFYIRVSSDEKLLRWRFAGRSGTVKPGTIVLRAPRKEGTYRLYVLGAHHADRAKVKVERIR